MQHLILSMTSKTHTERCLASSNSNSYQHIKIICTFKLKIWFTILVFFFFIVSLAWQYLYFTDTKFCQFQDIISGSEEVTLATLIVSFKTYSLVMLQSYITGANLRESQSQFAQSGISTEYHNLWICSKAYTTPANTHHQTQ